MKRNRTNGLRKPLAWLLLQLWQPLLCLCDHAWRYRGIQHEMPIAIHDVASA